MYSKADRKMTVSEPGQVAESFDSELTEHMYQVLKGEGKLDGGATVRISNPSFARSNWKAHLKTPHLILLATLTRLAMIDDIIETDLLADIKPVKLVWGNSHAWTQP